jgi:hypothetical protein
MGNVWIVFWIDCFANKRLLSLIANLKEVKEVGDKEKERVACGLRVNGYFRV